MTISTSSGDTPNFPEASTYSAYITEELQRYDEHLRDVRGLAAGTRKGRLRTIGWLLEGKFKHREIVIARMQPDDIRQFLARRLSENQSASNASQHSTALRSYRLKSCGIIGHGRSDDVTFERERSQWQCSGLLEIMDCNTYALKIIMRS